MEPNQLDFYIKDYADFPKKGILFKDIFPILSEPEVFADLINKMIKVERYFIASSFCASSSSSKTSSSITNII